MTTPAIGAIREHFPQAEITLLANPLVSQLFSPHPWIDRVITFDRNGAHKGIAGRFRLAAQLRKEAFDAAIILPNSFDSALIPWLAGIPVRLGKSSDGRGILLTGCYRPDDRTPICHEVGYYLGLVNHFGITGQAAVPYLSTTSAEDGEADALLAKHGIQADDFVLGINPGAAFGSAKRWYPDRFADVARQLSRLKKARVVIFGGPGETDIAAEIEQQLGGACLNLAGTTTVRGLMALIRNCNLFVTNDSGPMHIAAAFGVPLVAIFGSTDHTTTSPYTEKAVIVRKDVACAPCKLRECPTDHRCMNAVTADDVVSAAKQLLENTSRTPWKPSTPSNG
ncbi:MAG: lipopolysaccharide heptosyltransferase II [Verrucomicrobia bacterium]|nr:lipopolysaccharide heptosyltransferase II [Deltaproteobacteria bacterium]